MRRCVRSPRATASDSGQIVDDVGSTDYISPAGPYGLVARGRKRPMSNRVTRTKVMGLIIAAGLIAAACGGGAAPSAAPSVAASAKVAPGTLPAPEVTTIRIGISAPTEPVQYAEKL